MPDFTVKQHGSIVILKPHTEEARYWIDMNLPEDAMQWDGGVVIEANYIDDIITGIDIDGLEVVL